MKTKMGKSFRRSSPLKIGTIGRDSNESLPLPTSTEAFPILVLHRKAHEGFIESMKKKGSSRAGNFPKAGLKRFGTGAKTK
jgi:hypothetical protein